MLLDIGRFDAFKNYVALGNLARSRLSSRQDPLESGSVGHDRFVGAAVAEWYVCLESRAAQGLE